VRGGGDVSPRESDREEKSLTEEEIKRRQEIQEIKDLLARSFIALRKQRGFRSREALALSAGVNKESLGRLERGEGNSRLETLIRVSLALGLSLAELFDAMGQRERQGRQLTVQERKDAVNGLLLALESFTGRTSGELTERGIERSMSPGMDVRYPVLRRRSRPSGASEPRQSPQPAPPSKRGEPRKVAKFPNVAKSPRAAKSRKDAHARKSAKPRKSGTSRKSRKRRRKP
jgi:transcriptional regulator with XRE-family HTH domain